RNFDPGRRPSLSVLVAGRSVLDETEPLAAGAFLRFATLPRDLLDDTDRHDYAPLIVSTTDGVRVAVEQFDASATRPLAGFGDGWHEQELNPRTGLRWRWLSERGELKVHAPTGRASLHIEGESPRTYFSRGSHLVVRTGGRTVLDRVLDDDFSLDVPIENAGDTIVLETDQTY